MTTRFLLDRRLVIVVTVFLNVIKNIGLYQPAKKFYQLNYPITPSMSSLSGIYPPLFAVSMVVKVRGWAKSASFLSSETRPSRLLWHKEKKICGPETAHTVIGVVGFLRRRRTYLIIAVMIKSILLTGGIYKETKFFFLFFIPKFSQGYYKFILCLL